MVQNKKGDKTVLDPFYQDTGHATMGETWLGHDAVHQGYQPPKDSLAPTMYYAYCTTSNHWKGDPTPDRGAADRDAADHQASYSHSVAVGIVEPPAS